MERSERDKLEQLIKDYLRETALHQVVRGTDYDHPSSRDRAFVAAHMRIDTWAEEISRKWEKESKT